MVIYSEQVHWKQVLETTKLSQSSLAWSQSAIWKWNWRTGYFSILLRLT